MVNEDLPRYVDASALAHEIGRHPRTVRRWIQEGDVEGGKLVGRWIVTEDAAERLRKLHGDGMLAADLASQVERSLRTVRRWIQDDRIRGVKFRGQWWVPKADAEKVKTALEDRERMPKIDRDPWPEGS